MKENPFITIKDLNLHGQELLDEFKYYDIEQLDLHLEISGKWHHDFGWFDTDQGFRELFGDQTFNETVRRGRITFDMIYRDNVFARAEFDVSSSEREAKDVYIGINNIPYVGTLMAGHFREPFSLETLTSGNFFSSARVPGSSRLKDL